MKGNYKMLPVMAVIAVALFAALTTAQLTGANVAAGATTTTTTLKAVTTTARASAGCADTDGGKVYNVKGVTNGGNGRFNDKCTNPNDLKEYYCEGPTVRSVSVRCDRGCSLGACRSETGTELGTVSSGSSTATTTTTIPAANIAVTTTTIPSKCSDTDGGKDYYVKGDTDGTNGEFQDSCSTRGRIREYYCDGDMALNVLYRCPKGCLNRACKGVSTAAAGTITTTSTSSQIMILKVDVVSTTLQASAASISCTDSDGGKEYGIKGKTNGVNGMKADKCRNPTILEENYCDGSIVKMDLHTCQKGCYQGYCREDAGA